MMNDTMKITEQTITKAARLAITGMTKQQIADFVTAVCINILDGEPYEFYINAIQAAKKQVLK